MYIGICYDLRDEYLRAGFSEHDTAEFDRADTIDALASALQRLGHHVERIGNVRSLTRCLASGLRYDLVFNIAEGLYGFGREAQVPALLDAYAIPYTFSGPLSCALTLHKAMAKHVIRDCGLPTADFMLVERMADLRDLQLEFPLFAKPVAEGTGKGVDSRSKIDDLSSLHDRLSSLLNEYHQPVLVERYLPGREFTAAIVGTGARARCIGVMEIVLKAPGDVEAYGYQNKEECETRVEYRLVREPIMVRLVEEIALASWRALLCADAGRVDLRCDAAGRPNFMEINPLAGLHPEHSDLPIICDLQGIEYDQLIAWIVESACARFCIANIVAAWRWATSQCATRLHLERANMKVLLVHDALGNGAAADARDVLVQCEAVRVALARLGHSACVLPITPDLEAFTGTLRTRRPDLVFNLGRHWADNRTPAPGRCAFRTAWPRVYWLRRKGGTQHY